MGTPIYSVQEARSLARVRRGINGDCPHLEQQAVHRTPPPHRAVSAFSHMDTDRPVKNRTEATMAAPFTMHK